MPQISQVLRECAIGMLTAGMSTRAVSHESNVHFSTISCLQRHFRKFGSTSNRPHNHRPCVTTPVRTSTSSIFTSKIVWDQPPGQLLQQSVYITKEFLHKLSETISGKLICMLVILIGSRPDCSSLSNPNPLVFGQTSEAIRVTYDVRWLELRTADVDRYSKIKSLPLKSMALSAQCRMYGAVRGAEHPSAEALNHWLRSSPPASARPLRRSCWAYIAIKLLIYLF